MTHAKYALLDPAEQENIPSNSKASSSNVSFDSLKRWKSGLLYYLNDNPSNMIPLPSSSGLSLQSNTPTSFKELFLKKKFLFVLLPRQSS